MISRRKFIQRGIGLTGAAAISASLPGCGPQHMIGGKLSGPDAALGHRLRQGKFDAPRQTERRDAVIIGGGIAGLSAARQLNAAGTDFVLLELEKEVGGNSSSRSNAVSAFPLGAHYLPVPGLHDSELIRFLEEIGVITGYDQGKPIYNEYYLCFDPKERLYLHDHWQEGLVPHDGIPSGDRAEIARFQDLIRHYRDLSGADGKEVFCIPLAMCSEDPVYRRLDNITFSQFLLNQKFTSPYLTWYVNYCCRDDYGATTATTSAWAGLHYFTSRKSVIANTLSDSVLTWPEGNGWLVSKLKAAVHQHILPQSLVYSVSLQGSHVHVDYFDAVASVTKRIVAKKAIVASPQFVAQRMLTDSRDRNVDYEAFSYAPWMVANITVQGELNNRRGEPLCWDNVIYGSDSLGYVNANHQQVNQHTDKRVLTYYLPLTESEPKQERQKAHSKTYPSWQERVLADLKKPHPAIAADIESLDVWVWGHGMIRPTPGFITGENIRNARLTLGNKIFFAHSDLSGISIFEEAFYRGTLAAKNLLNS